jgi:exodeoxyribonuclease VII large subunit
LDALAASRVFRRPLDQIHDLARRIDELQMRAARAIDSRLVRARDRLGGLSGQLESLSPLAVLGRGYSLTQRVDDGQLITDASQVAPGQQVATRLSRGQLVSRIERVTPDDPQP